MGEGGDLNLFCHPLSYTPFPSFPCCRTCFIPTRLFLNSFPPPPLLTPSPSFPTIHAARVPPAGSQVAQEPGRPPPSEAECLAFQDRAVLLAAALGLGDDGQWPTASTKAIDQKFMKVYAGAQRWRWRFCLFGLRVAAPCAAVAFAPHKLSAPRLPSLFQTVGAWHVPARAGVAELCLVCSTPPASLCVRVWHASPVCVACGVCRVR